MTPEQRMETAYREHPQGIGRDKLAELAQVGTKMARTFLRKKRETMETVVSLTDWHVPHEDERAVNCALNFCKAIQPDVIVMHEVHDFYDLSRFNQDPARKDTLQDELDGATKYLRRLRKFCPDSRLIMLESNHLDRLRRFLWTEGRPLSSLRALKLESLLELPELDIELREVWHHKGVLFKHGNIVRRHSAYTAKGEFDKEGCAGVTGHTHRLGAFYTRKRGGSYVWIESGCLCDLDPEYISGVADWQHGLTLVNFERNGSQYFAEPVPIINGQLIYGGRVISA